MHLASKDKTKLTKQKGRFRKNICKLVKVQKIGASWKWFIFLLSCQEGLAHQGSNLSLLNGYSGLLPVCTANQITKDTDNFPGPWLKRHNFTLNVEELLKWNRATV